MDIRRDTKIPIIKADGGQNSHDQHNRHVDKIGASLDALDIPRIRMAETNRLFESGELSLHHRGERWDVVFEDEEGILWGIELKKLRLADGRELDDLGEEK